MCGINGILSFKKPINHSSIDLMNRALEHRGPDNGGVDKNKFCHLGHRRLSIIDLSSAGNQPFLSNDGRYSIVYNGELYNFLEIKSKIKSYSFNTDTDTEVVLAAFLEWGKKCVDFFNGMFALAIWDKDKEELFIARDRLGIKPLYYYNNNGWFIFSSEVRGLLASEVVPRKIDKNSLSDYLRYQTVHAPNTLVNDVKMLEPGCFLTINKDTTAQVKYWKFSDGDNYSKDKSREEVNVDIKRLIYEAVEKRLVSDVPVGAFLSGGIDSSALVGIMSGVSENKINTYSVVFDESEFSEAVYSRKISKLFGTNHHEINLTPNVFLELIPDALSAMDHPSGDGPNTYVLSKYIKQAGITVAISGLGGDELFCGYSIFKQAHKIRSWDKLLLAPQFVRQGVGMGLKILKPSVSSAKMAELIKKDNFELASVYPVFRQVILEEDVEQLLGENNVQPNWVSKLAENTNLNLPFLSQVSELEVNTYMQNVLLRDTDQMSMAHALEVRVPFLDHELVSYVSKIRDEIKFPHSQKKLLTESLFGLLPSEVVNRPKMGFVFPWESWLKNELREFAGEILVKLAKRDFFNGNVVLDLWSRFLKGDKRVTWSRVWPLIVLENWLDKNEIE